MNGKPNGRVRLDTLTTEQQAALIPSYFEQRRQTSPRSGAQAGDGAHNLQPESLVPRLGDFLLEMGVLRREELQAALAEQQQRHRRGQPDLLGQVLLDLGFVDRSVLDHAVTLQVMEMHEALASHNQRLEKKVAQRTEQLEQALAQANRLQRQKDEFVNAISHELRTPLTFILGYLDLLELGDLGNISSEQARALAQMHNAGDKLHQLIDNLLFFASYCQDQFVASAEPLPVSVVFHLALKEKIDGARKRGIRLLVGPPPEGVLVTGDFKKIVWVISELLENALKFTNPGGEVRLMGQRKDDKTFEFVVGDSGPGIPAERLAEIFEPFHQLDGSITRKAGGIGLGLTVAQQIVQAHGSELEVTSREGEGTEVRFSLPICAEISE